MSLFSPISSVLTWWTIFLIEQTVNFLPAFRKLRFSTDLKGMQVSANLHGTHPLVTGAACCEKGEGKTVLRCRSRKK
jgi:hypothetical protein